MKTAARHCSVCALLLAVGVITLVAYAAFPQSNDLTATGHDRLHHQHSTEFMKVPEKARKRSNPLENDPDAMAAGRKLFVQHCAECHGNRAEGGRKAPNLHAEEVQNATPGTLFWIVTNGVVRRGMPVWSKLPEPERWQIVSFLKSLPPSTNAEPGQVHTHADPAQQPSNISDHDRQ